MRSVRLIVSLLMVGAVVGSIGLASAGGGRAGTALAASDAVVVTAQQTSYGSVLFTADGKALYILTFDTFGTPSSPAKSQCSGPCAGAWPPLLAPGPFGPFQTSGGVQAWALGTIQRADGTYQVTYHGYPLYLFVADKAPGDTRGENVAAFDGLWYLITVGGQPDAGVATVSLQSSPMGTVLSAPTAFNTFRSLYLLTADPPHVSTCFGGCARIWPPLLTTGQPIAGGGVNPSGLGTLRRPDGTMQVTYFGWPLYFFAFDLVAGAKSGLTNGEDVVDPFNKGVWYLVTPAGGIQPGPATLASGPSPFGTTLTYNKAPVYAFSADTSTSSACTGVCARIFTPVLTSVVPQADASSGVNQSWLGTITRPDGTAQVTYNGHPLYTYSQDYSGTSGQGLAVFGGTFGVMQGSGTPSTAVPAQRPVTVIPQLTRSGAGTTGSFVVIYTSKNPGRGAVYFGPGPGCSGLVEVGMRDSGAGTTSHSVQVTGNDLPGTVGNAGITPGATYFLEVVTTSASGQETDNNGGKCYSVTVPAS